MPIPQAAHYMNCPLHELPITGVLLYSLCEKMMPTNLSFAVPTSSKLDTCEVTGFESRVREECEGVSEVECTPIEVRAV